MSQKSFIKQVISVFQRSILGNFVASQSNPGPVAIAFLPVRGEKGLAATGLLTREGIFSFMRLFVCLEISGG